MTMTAAIAITEEGNSMKTLRIAPGLKLPLDVVTQTLAILARKGFLGSPRENTADPLAKGRHGSLKQAGRKRGPYRKRAA